MFKFKGVSRAQLLAASHWSSNDLDNRVHLGQLGLAFGLEVPAETGSYLGVDVFAMRLSDVLVEGGFTRAQAGQIVREHQDVWLQGIARIEWPDLFPAIEPMIWAPTKRALDEGLTEIPPDSEIYLAITRKPDSFQVDVGSAAEIIKANTVILASAVQAPIQTTCVNLRAVYERTLAAAVKAGVDLGAPFTRPEGHDEHREWFAAVEVHRALAAQRQKVRKPPGPARAKPKPKPTKKRAAQASARKRLLPAE